VKRSGRVIFAGALFGWSHVHAQEVGEPLAGLALAREACGTCHSVLPGQQSPSRQAPSFEQIASVPGMTPLALTVALQTPHKTMPNVMLDPKELRDLGAYIASLGNSP
jgi:mono/diheme cytochrome c family protein